ncbi:hypothetical protein PsorP6_003499 [Peronosclerospora sorghi]|uniref:Uncharacterized protein n=1 Tax=Peronosclerospora sorghi TaxID=230839 RepID=A0ACC0VKG2_9STRA|nr:hypothetical protein PsorP6_003499 [Peronosclerospora sorghi]
MESRQLSGSGHDIEAEMEHVLQFLDTSVITPPTGSDLVTQQIASQPERVASQQQLTPDQLSKVMEHEGGGCNDLGEVIDLLGSLDPNDATHGPLSRPSQDDVYAHNVGAVTSSEEPSRTAAGTSQLYRATSATTNPNGLDCISPMGILHGPSMSPATLNWLQTLVPSTSTESLTGLVSPATLFSAGSGSAASGIGGILGGTGNPPADATKSGGLPRCLCMWHIRSPSCEIIDWKAYNESCSDKVQKVPAKWHVIPQHGPHADTTVSSSSSTSTSAKLPPSGMMPSELTAQQQIHYAARKMAEERSKRKALVSPDYIQYGKHFSKGASATSWDPASGNKMENGSTRYGTKVLEPTGRRPFKKSVHQTTDAPLDLRSKQQLQKDATIIMSNAPLSDGNDDPVRCKCTGKCRNARCACVKAGMVCGVQCKCVSCANPFVPMAREGIDIQLMVKDICLMQYLSKIKDMQELLDSTVSYECCEGGSGVVQVKHTVETGFACPHCSAHYTYSWCNNRLCPDAKKPRRHCAKCRRCGDHRNQHCDLCQHCYFAGVANSFRCSCQSSRSGGGKTRAVVPNLVRRDSVSTSNQNNGDVQKVSHTVGAVDPVVNDCAREDTNSKSKQEADDSCKIQ